MTSYPAYSKPPIAADPSIRKARVNLHLRLHALHRDRAQKTTMSLKVPKANNVQLFKEGYKVCCPG